MRKSLGTVVLALILGALIGSILSKTVGLFLDEGTVAHKLFVNEVPWGHEIKLDLAIMVIRFSFELHFTLMSVVGVFVASQILRWYR
jgi:hypothetical protein